MNTRIAVAFCAMLLSHVAWAAAPATRDTASLYCTGKASIPRIQASEIDTEAIIRLGAGSVYIEVILIGSGQSKSAPEFNSGSMVGTGSLLMHPAFAGQEPFEAFYNLNRYSGQFILMNSDSNKVLFQATCKPASPLY